jgi:hypothetical protein
MEGSDKVTYQDRMWDEETVQQISDLRHERWALLAIMSIQKVRSEGTIFTATEMVRFDNRLKAVNAELFELTENPIYRVR